MADKKIVKKKRDPEKTRAHILDVSFFEIYTKGFNGVGVREIADKAGVTIGAFFHYFPTKQHVGFAIIEEVVRTGIMERWIKPLSAYKNPLQGILKCFKKTFDSWTDDLVKIGCPLNNLTQEMSATEPVLREKTESVLRDWISETEKHLKRAQSEGYLKKSTNTHEMATFIVTLQEGTFAMGKALQDRSVFDMMYTSLKDYIEFHSV